MKVAGSSTGAFLPTGNLTDEIDRIPVTCMDVAMPMVIARAADFGLSGYETRDELDKNIVFFQRMEALRIKAGAAMGMGDVRSSVTPKFGLIAPATWWKFNNALFHALENAPHNGCNWQSMFGLLCVNPHRGGWVAGKAYGNTC